MSMLRLWPGSADAKAILPPRTWTWTWQDFEIFISVFLVYGLLCELGIGCISSISLFVVNEAVFFYKIRVAKWFIEECWSKSYTPATYQYGQRFSFLFWVNSFEYLSVFFIHCRTLYFYLTYNVRIIMFFWFGFLI